MDEDNPLLADQNSFEDAPVPYLVTTPEGGILAANRQAAIMFNVPAQDLVGQSLFAFAVHDDRVWLQGRLNTVISTARPGHPVFSGELHLQPRDKPVTHVTFNLNMAYDDAQQVTALRWVLHGGRTVTTASRQPQPHWLHTLAENAPDILYRIRLVPTRQFDYVNPAVTAITGYTPEDHYADPDLGFKLVHPEDRPLLEQFARKGPDSAPLTLRWVCKDGRVIWTEQVNVPVYDDTGNLVALEGVARDVTDRKQAELALRTNQARYQQIARNIPAITYQFVLYPDGQYSMPYVSADCDKILGISAEAIMADVGAAFDLVSAQDQAQTIQQIAESAQTMTNFRAEYRLVRHDEQVVWVYLEATPRRVDTGEVIWDGIAIDLTEHKRIEQTLRDSEERYRKLVDILPDGVMVHQEGKCVFANHASARIVNTRSPDDLLGTSVLDCVHPDYRQGTLARLQDWLDARQNVPVFEEKFLRRDGVPIDVEVMATSFTYHHKPATLIVFWDISDRKQAELDLRASEAQYRALFDNASDAIFVHDLAGHILDVNRAACAQLGYSREALLQMTVHHLDQCPEFKQRRAELLATGFISFRAELRCSDGTIVPMEVNCRLIEYGGRPAILSTARNLTEREAMEAARRESEEKYRLLVEASHDGILLLGLEGQMLDCNSAARAMFGYDQDVIFRLTLDELVALDDVSLEDEAVLVEGTARRADGTTFLVEISTRHVMVNEEAMMIVYIHDITEHQRAEQQRVDLLLEKERVRMLTNFVQDVSHEFRTPLSVIHVLADTLEKTLQPPVKSQQRLARIKAQTDYIGKLIEAMLTMSQLDSQVQGQMTAVNLNQLLHNIATNVQAQVDSKALTLQFDLAAAAPVVYGNERQLYQALYNIVDNAIQFTPDEGTVTLQTRTSPEQVQVRVMDTGSGIHPDDIPHIFKRFFRGDKSRTSRGAGLGLSIAAKAVELHSGHIQVDSQPDQGSTFTVSLPRA